MSITPPPKKKPQTLPGCLVCPIQKLNLLGLPSSPVVKFSHSQGRWGGMGSICGCGSSISYAKQRCQKNWTYYLEVGRRGKGWQTFSVKLSNSKYFRLCLCHPIFVQLLRCLVSNSVGQLSVSWGQVSRKTIFSSDWEGRDGFRMIQVHYIHGALYFYYY